MMHPKQYIHSLIWAKRHFFGQLTPVEVKFIQPFIDSRSICFDVGAHAGSWTRYLSRVAWNGLVFSFEALPYYADVLRTTMKLLRCKNVTVINAAVTDKEGTVALIWKDASGKRLTGMTHIAGFHESQGERVSVRGTTLDSFWKSIEEKTVDFVKCDVEGTEFSVLQGSQCLIHSCRPIFFLEIEKRWCERYNYAPTKIFNLFSGLDYTPYKVDLQLGLQPVDGSTHTRGDVLFVPHERRLS